MARPSKYSADFRARAMRLVAEARPEHETEWAAITSVANKLGSVARRCGCGFGGPWSMRGNGRVRRRRSRRS